MFLELQILEHEVKKDFYYIQSSGGPTSNLEIVFTSGIYSKRDTKSISSKKKETLILKLHRCQKILQLYPIEI